MFRAMFMVFFDYARTITLGEKELAESKFITNFLDEVYMKNIYKPYNIDIEHEIKTYLNVGKDYGNSKTADKGWVLNLTRFMRRKRNIKREEYTVCNTYSEWEEHVESILNKGILNYTDFLHWLYQQKRKEEKYLDAVKTILIPIYIALISISNLWDGDVWTITGIFIVTTIFSTWYLHGATERVNFYYDFIKVAEKNK